MQQEEQEQGEQTAPGSIRDYMNQYKKFSETLTMALKMIVSEEFTTESMAETKASLQALTQQIPMWVSYHRTVLVIRKLLILTSDFVDISH